MKSYALQVDGAEVRLLPVDAPRPVPGPGQLLVRMRAAGLNRGELIPGGLVKGGAPKPAGIEGAGEVAALGPGVAGPAVGTRVMGRCPAAFAEFALMDVREAMPVPADLGFEQAAAVPLAFLVAHDMVVLQGRLQPTDWLLVLGVSSGVGVASLQLARLLGARVIGTSGSQAKLERLRALGLEVALCTRQGDFAAAVLQATGDHGADLVVNAVGGSVFAEAVRCMAFQGRLATVGYVDRTLEAPLDLQALHARRLTLFGVSNKLRSAAQRAEGVPAFCAQVLPALADGRLQPLVDRVFAFDEAAAAVACMAADRHVGKLVLRMDD